MPLNPSILSLPPSYLFTEIANKARKEQARCSERALIPLGIGDVTAPLSPVVARAMSECALSMEKTIIGYQSESGSQELRSSVANFLSTEKYHVPVEAIHIQDGAKPIFARILSLFGTNTKISSFTPAYPAFKDAAFSLVQAPSFSLLDPITENVFEVLEANPPEVLVLCSPNNPTGDVFDTSFLKKLVALARRKKILIIHDAAYSFFLNRKTHTDLIKSLYEIEGASDVVIEIGSLSKSHGFTGLRLGWAVIPNTLIFADLSSSLKRLFASTFNGACCIAQQGAIAALTPEGIADAQRQAATYMRRAAQLKTHFEIKGWQVEGGPHTPFVWMRPRCQEMFSKGSWHLFDLLLEQYGIISTPGIGFGPQGEGYLRLSGFAPQDTINLAIERVQNSL